MRDSVSDDQPGGVDEEGGLVECFGTVDSRIRLALVGKEVMVLSSKVRGIAYAFLTLKVKGQHEIVGTPTKNVDRKAYLSVKLTTI